MLIECEACWLLPTSVVSSPLPWHSQPIMSATAGRTGQPPPLGDDTEGCTPLSASPALVVDVVLAASTTPPLADPSPSSPRRSSPRRNSPPSSAARRLDLFTGIIQKLNVLPLITQPAPPLPAASTTGAPWRSSTRLASRKLAKIPRACHGEVLLMLRFEMATKGEPCTTADETFTSGITRDRVEQVLGMFSLHKATSGRRQGVAFIA